MHGKRIYVVSTGGWSLAYSSIFPTIVSSWIEPKRRCTRFRVCVLLPMVCAAAESGAQDSQGRGKRSPFCSNDSLATQSPRGPDSRSYLARIIKSSARGCRPATEIARWKNVKLISKTVACCCDAAVIRPFHERNGACNYVFCNRHWSAIEANGWRCMYSVSGNNWWYNVAMSDSVK